METQRMFRPALAGLIGTILVLVACAPSVPVRTATPAPSQEAPAPLTETFTSALYGYSIKYPAKFDARSATQPIRGAGLPFLGSEVVDEISTTGDVSEGVVVMAAAKLDTGTTLTQWTEMTARGPCHTPASSESVDLDGEHATLDTFPACEGWFHQWVTAMHDGRGYHIVWVRNPGYEVSDRAQFMAMLETFTFGPVPEPTLAADPLPDPRIGAWYRKAPA